MKYDLKNTTFIVPIRIESDDRLRNVITTCCFLLENFDTFYRMRYINEMLTMCETEVVVNYDCDVLLPLQTYLQAQKLIIEDEADVIYPYGQGMWQKKIYATDQMVSEFLSNDCDFKYLEPNHQMDNAESGHVQFFRKSTWIEGGMENENFKSYSPEDKERLFRFVTLGYRVVRIEGFVYHLEHKRGQNSWITNPHMQDNNALWQFLQSLNKDELKQYYKEQKYLKKYQ